MPRTLIAAAEDRDRRLWDDHDTQRVRESQPERNQGLVQHRHTHLQAVPHAPCVHLRQVVVGEDETHVDFDRMCGEALQRRHASPFRAPPMGLEEPAQRLDAVERARELPELALAEPRKEGLQDAGIVRTSQVVKEERV